MFEEPLTVAVNCCEAPRRTLAEAGAMETVTEADGDGDEVELLPWRVLPVQPSTAHARIAITKRLHQRTVVAMDWVRGQLGSGLPQYAQAKDARATVLRYRLGKARGPVSTRHQQGLAAAKSAEPASLSCGSINTADGWRVFGTGRMGVVIAQNCRGAVR